MRKTIHVHNPQYKKWYYIGYVWIMNVCNERMDVRAYSCVYTYYHGCRSRGGGEMGGGDISPNNLGGGMACIITPPPQYFTIECYSIPTKYMKYQQK